MNPLSREKTMIAFNFRSPASGGPDRDRLTRFLRNTSGSYLIEAAILFPILLGIGLAVIEFGFIFMREQTVKNYMAQMVQRIERNQINIDPVVTAMNNDPLLRGQNIQVCTTTASSCTGNSRITTAAAGQNVVVNVQRNYTPLTPVGNLMNFQIGTPSGNGARTLTRRETVNTGATNFNCPAGQVLQSITNSRSVCVVPPVNMRCPAGQVLQSIVNTSPVCLTPSVNVDLYRIPRTPLNSTSHNYNLFVGTYRACFLTEKQIFFDGKQGNDKMHCKCWAQPTGGGGWRIGAYTDKCEMDCAFGCIH